MEGNSFVSGTCRAFPRFDCASTLDISSWLMYKAIFCFEVQLIGVESFGLEMDIKVYGSILGFSEFRV